MCYNDIKLDVNIEYWLTDDTNWILRASIEWKQLRKLQFCSYSNKFEVNKALYIDAAAINIECSRGKDED
jgi:hypothetical protein